MSEIFTADVMTAFHQVIMIDLVLAGDNAIVVGMAAAGLPAVQRRRAIVVGILAAAVLRIVFSFFTVQLLQIIGLLLAGGLLLLWVAWRLWRELRPGGLTEDEAEAEAAQPRFLSTSTMFHVTTSRSTGTRTSQWLHHGL